MKPLVSIIIPTYKGDPCVDECVAHVKESSFKDYEIIVVNEGLERSAQRNIGIARAKGKYFLILDSDMMITSELLKECVYLSTAYQCGALYIPERIVTKGWFGRLRDWERQFYNGSLVDVVRFIRADLCPRFDEELHGVEDSDWERRIPECFKMTTKNHFNHHDRVGLIKYLKKKSYYAKCLNKYRAKHPNDRLLTFRYRCFLVFIEKGKWKRLICAPHMAFGVALLLLARGLIFWHRRIFYK